MNTYNVTVGEREITVEAWKFEIEHGVAMFYDRRGELTASFRDFTFIVRVCPTKP